MIFVPPSLLPSLFPSLPPLTPPPPTSTLFPYTTLFRSCLQHREIFLHMARRMGIGQPHDVLDRRAVGQPKAQDRKSTRLNSSHRCISYAVFCLKKKKIRNNVWNSCTS